MQGSYREREREATESTDIKQYANKHIVHQEFSLLWNVDHSCYGLQKNIVKVAVVKFTKIMLTIGTFHLRLE